MTVLLQSRQRWPGLHRVRDCHRRRVSRPRRWRWRQGRRPRCRPPQLMLVLIFAPTFCSGWWVRRSRSNELFAAHRFIL